LPPSQPRPDLPARPGRTSNPPASSPRRGRRPLLAATFTAALLALTANAAFAQQGVWQTLPSAPTVRSALAGTTAPCPHARHRTCVYAIGGFNGISALNTVEAYSPATNTWATLPSLPTAHWAPAGATAPCAPAHPQRSGSKPEPARLLTAEPDGSP
jgi:hypothetical protein